MSPARDSSRCLQSRELDIFFPHFRLPSHEVYRKQGEPGSGLSGMQGTGNFGLPGVVGNLERTCNAAHVADIGLHDVNRVAVDHLVSRRSYYCPVLHR